MPPRGDAAPTVALAPAPASPLVRIAKASLPAPGLSGFRLMPLGSYSLDARVELARRATQSLDLQYYQIHNDRTGHLLLRNVRDAALRGVRGGCSSTTSTRPAAIRCSSASPRSRTSRCGSHPLLLRSRRAPVQVRVVAARHPPLDHRMHNKLFIADSAVVVAEGRNIADEYFMRSMTTTSSTSMR